MEGNFRIAIWSAIALLVSVLHGAEHGKIQIYDDVEYVITTPSGCTSWMLARTAVDASQFHGFRDDCNTTAFSTGVSQSRLFTYAGKLSIHKMINTTDCCIEVEVDHSSGWVARDLLDVAPEGRAVYDAHVAEERAKAQEEARKEAKKEAEEAGRRKKLAAERKKNEAEEAARLAKIKSERDARALEELSKVVAACSKIYHSTIDKKRGDLTVREEEQVKVCQSLNLYPPQ